GARCARFVQRLPPRRDPGVPRPSLAPPARAPGPAAGALLPARGLAPARGVRYLSSRAARRLEVEPPRRIDGAGGRGPARGDARERSPVGAALRRVPC